MPELDTVSDIAIYNTVDDLKAWMIKARAYGWVTLNQGKAIVQHLTPMLPTPAKLQLRTPKSILYVTAGTMRFRVNQRAQIISAPWNPNPRKKAKNPWAD